MQWKNRSELAKTQFRLRPVQRPKKTAVLAFFHPGPVFLILGNVWTSLGLSPFCWAKKLDWTRLSSTQAHSDTQRQQNRPCDVMISYLGTPPVATFEIDGNVVGKYVIFGKCCHSPNTEYEICMYLQWKSSLNIMLISMIFCSVRYLHMPEHATQNCSWNSWVLGEVSWFYVWFFPFDADIP